MLTAVTATRYVTPLREGGSLPGLMEADDLGTYVVKWRAAGQGVKVLVAEVVCGELARALDLKGAIHIGHSTGGGEVARYAARAEAGRIAKAVLIGAVPPVMAKTESNSDGIRLS